MSEQQRHPDDPVIVAYLDGELDPAERATFVARLAAEPGLMARLEVLDRGGAGIADAMTELKARAPKPRLDDILAQAIAQHEAEGANVVPLRRAPLANLSTRQLIAASIALLLLGGIASDFLRGAQMPWRDQPSGSQTQSVEAPEAGQHENWRQAVAEYWSLMTPDTLALTPTPERAAAELQLASRKLGVDLADAPERLPSLSFRGAQLFDFHGRPLVQMAFLDPEHGPIAYCVIDKPDKAEIPRTTETLGGFTIVHWASGGQARLIIGRAPAERLQALATDVSG
jgi:anti-sigma factor RsiW